MRNLSRERAEESERGNVIFFILIAIALLAALSFAITQGGRESTTNISAEKERLLATGILDYADVVQKTAQLLRSRGVAFAALSFADPGLAGAYGAPGAAPGNEIFNTQGGAALYKTADTDAFAGGVQPYAFSATNEVAQVGTSCAAADCTDLLMLLPGLKKDVCVTINNQLAIGAADADPPIVAALDATPFAGTAAYVGTVGNDSPSAAIAGKSAACVYDTHVSGYTFYQVLVPR